MRLLGVIFTAVFVIIVLSLFVGAIWHPFRATGDLRRESAIRQLALETTRALQMYYDTNKAYPKTVMDLPGTLFQFRDGSSAAMLKKLRYVSDGQSYQFTWESKWPINVSCTATSQPVWVQVSENRAGQPKAGAH